jgi:N-acyl-D-aspartate/D-glutamate deacylase
VSYDTIIRNGRRFDGTGAPSAVRNIGIRDGHVVAISPHDLDDKGCPRVVDATGKWVLPGMLDIHTHYDVEVLNGPSLSESLRHGVTTAMLGSCSLSTVHVDGVDAGDIFGRVEAIPREHVISAVDDHKTWTNAEEYIQALEARPAADVKANPYASWGMGPAARLILRIGDRADLVVIDPERLDAKLDDYAEDRVEQYGGLSRMVNRNDDTVNAVFVGGRAVFVDGKATDLVGEQRTGRFLRAAHKAPALSAQEMEFASGS